MKIKLTKTLFLFIGVAFLSFELLTGCKKSKDEEETVTPTPTTPADTCGTPLMSFLADGHILTYDFTYFSNTFVLTMKTKSYGNAGEFKTILSSTLINDSVYSRECGGWLYRSAAYPLLNTYKYRKSSTAVNDTYTYSDAAVTAVYKVIAKNVSITVPAGTFICDKITYKQNGTINTDTLYFNNSVGDIKYVGSAFDYKLKTKNF